jgi:HNH endonuclease
LIYAASIIGYSLGDNVSRESANQIGAFRRNPNWTEDELVIALDLYFKTVGAGDEATPDHPLVKTASELLKRTNPHDLNKCNAKFRAPDGVMRRVRYFTKLAKGESIKGHTEYVRVFEKYRNDIAALGRRVEELKFGISGEFDYRAIERDLKSIKKDKYTSKTEKEQLSMARIGQGAFRQGVQEYWKTCAITGCEILLTASHIKPWSESGNMERLDPFNGLLLSPNFDRAFDQGWITFDNSGVIQISPSMKEQNMQKLGISRDIKINLHPKHLPYLAYHRSHKLIH